MKNQKAVCVSNSAKLLRPFTSSIAFPHDSEYEDYIDLKVGKTYEILDLQHGMISIIDESNESYFYPISLFDVDFEA